AVLAPAPAIDDLHRNVDLVCHALAFRGRGRELERQRVAAKADRHGAAVLERAAEDLVGEPIAAPRLDDAGERTRAEGRVVAFLREILPRVGLQDDRNPALGELLLELDDELVDDR